MSLLEVICEELYQEASLLVLIAAFYFFESLRIDRNIKKYFYHER